MARQLRQTRGRKGPRKTRKQGKRKGDKTRKRVMGKRRKRTMRGGKKTWDEYKQDFSVLKKICPEFLETML